MHICMYERVGIYVCVYVCYVYMYACMDVYACNGGIYVLMPIFAEYKYPKLVPLDEH
jgi:hypothetical protein